MAVSRERIEDHQAHNERVADMARQIRRLQATTMPGALIAKIIAAAPMRLYGEAREIIYGKEN